jgi:hypothetical protein
MDFLEQDNGGHGSKAKSTVHSAEGGSSTGLSAALLAGVGTGDIGVGKLALAEVFALDELLVLEGLVESAGVGDVLGGLNVEGTQDAVKLRGSDPADNY